ncbi:CapA family protein [Pseudonocardia humida]|uniref:CapA family protein n=1 Tax=Pseudonocardia humida TaxID=2800819 RepID=A0ABT1ADC9_9PSEU|nr:CapA family protein [Pseudonocardia humida]MCO1660906.1 CapA family protein [Pseudonocardia humida]
MTGSSSARARHVAAGAVAAALALTVAACAGDRSGGTTGAPLPTFAAPTSAPAAQPPARQRLVVHATGDVNLDPDYIPALRTRGHEHAWTGLDGLFTTDGLTVVNLECPVSTRGTPADKRFTFRCDPDALPVARDAGVDVANLANNHGRDYGATALLDSIEHATSAGIAPVGVGADATAAAEPAIVERGGWRIAVLGFGGVVPAAEWLAGPARPGMASGDDIPTMTAAVRAAGARADLVFVTIHWGAELDTEPRPEDVARARAMVDAGADAVFGHHSHRLQPMTTYRDRPIAWGLGNFVWPVLSQSGARTAVARVVVEPDGAVRGCLLPARIATHGHPVLSGPRTCPR